MRHTAQVVFFSVETHDVLILNGSLNCDVVQFMSVNICLEQACDLDVS
jgi:hypothetical protein